MPGVAKGISSNRFSSPLSARHLEIFWVTYGSLWFLMVSYGSLWFLMVPYGFLEFFWVP